MNDTIAAIATPVGAGGIGIVRISGPDALRIADELFASRKKMKPSGFASHTVHYGWIARNGAALDEVILTVMRSPRTYTREDIVEINCHGGIAAVQSVLDAALSRGCRLAEPGEFTRRAFLNGRIDLAQAEAVLDAIQAKTEEALQASIEHLRGALSAAIRRIADDLSDVLTAIEAEIDFAESDCVPPDKAAARRKLLGAHKDICALAGNARYGRIVREGIHAVICGRANAGKSSLLNALLNYERSIVTAIPGTTRDTIEEIVNIRGIPVKLVDTPGILRPRNIIEKKAIKKSKTTIAVADLLLCVFDGSRPLGSEDRSLIRAARRCARIAVVNKSDLAQIADTRALKRDFDAVVTISAKRGKNIDILEDEIVRHIRGGACRRREYPVVMRLRHAQLLDNAARLIGGALAAFDENMPLECAAQDIKDGLRQLEDILGTRVSGDILDRIFSEFCIGK